MGLIQVLNVKFFRKNNVLDKLSINRGVYCVWMGVTKEGGLVVKIKGFDRYYFDPETCEVFSRVAARNYRPMKKCDDGGKPYYRLYLNGQPEKVTVARILRENIKGIEMFFSEENRDGRKKHHHLELTSA